MLNEKYLRLLAKEFPTIAAATGEIIHLNALRSLPKETEYFFSDLHGEHFAFINLLRSASGNIRTKIAELYENILSEEEQNQLANLVYDPLRVVSLVRDSGRMTDEWIRITIFRLVDLCNYVSAKEPRVNIRAKAPKEFANIIMELLGFTSDETTRKNYYNQIIQSVIDVSASVAFIDALCTMIQRISVGTLHIIGDIFDRGAGPHHIMEELMTFPNVDIQWGNHDIQWMAAAAGNEVAMASVLRIGISYNNFDALEDGYGLNLRPLSSFASEVYGDDPCHRFMPKLLDVNEYDEVDPKLAAKMHKAIAIIQFKLEGQLLKRHPEYQMDDRQVLLKTDFKRLVYQADGKEYPLLDTNFPTIDPDNPLALTEEEADLLVGIRASFNHSEPLHRHISYLYSHGSSYKIVNNNLLFHGCLPMTSSGEFQSVEIDQVKYSGKAYMDYIDEQLQRAYFTEEGDNSLQVQNARDFMWYLWCGPISPMFGKDKMATFENYFVDDKTLRREIYNPYYQLSQKEEICNKIFEEFGLDSQRAHIVNGHVPVKIKDGESPVKANGKLFVIDGGISKAYQPRTGIAGYTMIFNSHHLALAEHTSFSGIENDTGSYTPKLEIVEAMPRRLRVSDTDLGEELAERIRDLRGLIKAYQTGWLKERTAQNGFL